MESSEVPFIRLEEGHRLGEGEEEEEEKKEEEGEEKEGENSLSLEGTRSDSGERSRQVVGSEESAAGEGEENGASGEECRICGEVELSKSNRLIAPCDCAGSISKVHVECLEKWILNRPGNRAIGDNLECEICHSQYRVSLRHRLKLNMESLCTCGTFSHLFEGVLMVCSVALLTLLVAKRLPELEQHHPDLPDTRLIMTLCATVILLGAITLRRITLRWFRTSSTPQVTIVSE